MRDIWVSEDGKRLLYGADELRALKDGGSDTIAAKDVHRVSVDDAWRAYATLLDLGWRPSEHPGAAHGSVTAWES